jgi:dTMP kinase
MATAGKRDALFVVFEGIDGSGKTTLSNRVAARLRAQGLTVAHVRENGQFASAVTQSIRELGRDQRHLAMTPRAEMLLMIARDLQLLEEATLPALKTADVVLADRFFYTAEVLAEHGRGLSRHAVKEVVRAISCSVEPDLVFLIDVDPHLARARRRVSKLLAPTDRPSSRKGLAGVGIQHRMRDGYREIAQGDPARWVVVDNTNSALADVEATLTEALLTARREGVAKGREIANAAFGNREEEIPRASTPEEARARFLAWIDDRAEREPHVAAYLLGGLHGPGIDERRIALAETSPVVTAAGLRGMNDPTSWQLRKTLLPLAPREIVASLREEAGQHPDAMSVRAQLCADAPAEVAVSLTGDDSQRAWLLRAELHKQAPVSVLQSLAGLGSERSWTWREQLLGRLGGAKALSSYEVAEAAAKAVSGLDDDRAWRWRDAAYDTAPAPVIESLVGATSQRAQDVRDRHIDRAPKAVMRSLFAMSDGHAWSLREHAAASCKEAVDSIAGMDEPRAWWLRMRCRDLWPSTVVGSMGTTPARTPSGMELVQYLLAHHGGIALLRAAAGLAV